MNFIQGHFVNTSPDEYVTLSEQLEQAETARLFAQWRYYLAEAKKIELALAQRQNRADTGDTLSTSASTGRRPSATAKSKSTKRGQSRPPSPRRRFLVEGPTTVIIRQLYENRAGMTNFELQARNGTAIKGRTIRKIINRLISAGYAIREGKKAVLVESGISAWEASPLFLRSSRNTRAA